MGFDLYLVALGNPGPKFSSTRHNAGFMLADHLRALADKTQKLSFPSLKNTADCWEMKLAGRMILLVKPRTYMNNSGDAVKVLLQEFLLDVETQLFLAYDDLDLPLGAVRLRSKGSAGTHRGMASVLSAVGHGNFPRLRLGIGPKPPQRRAEDFVLEPFDLNENAQVKVMIEKAAGLWEAIAAHGLDMAISKYQALQTHD